MRVAAVIRRRPFFQAFWQILSVAVFAFAACAVVHAAPPPSLSLKDVSGKQVSLADFSGKIVVLNFWATWCEPCQDEMPMLNKLAATYADKDVVFIAASIDDSDSVGKIPHFLAKRKISLPVWVGATPDTLKEFDLGKIIPATIIFDRDGSVVGRLLGQARRNDVISRLDWVLGGKAGAPPKPLVKHL